MGVRPSNHFILVKSAESFFRLLCYMATFWMKKWNLGYMDKKSWEKEAVAWDEDFIVFCGSPVWCMRPIFTAKKQKTLFPPKKYRTAAAAAAVEGRKNSAPIWQEKETKVLEVAWSGCGMPQWNCLRLINKKIQCSASMASSPFMEMPMPFLTYCMSRNSA